MQTHKILLDTDPGIDDFFAMLLLADAQNVELCGVTAVAGNQVMDKIVRNARGIAALLGWTCPVAAGAAGPMCLPQITAGEVHGDTGLGHFPLPAPTAPLDARPAWELLYEQARALDGALEVLAIGPLTNLAVAFLAHPDLPRYLRRIVVMGGSTEWGNRGAYGEFNFYVDPHAAAVVFGAGVPIDMVGLNVTMQTGISDAEFDGIARLVGETGRAYSELLDFYRNIYRDNDLGFQIVAMHDSLAAALLMDEGVLDLRPAAVRIDCSPGPCRGRSLVDFASQTPNARVAVAVDRPRFWELVLHSLRRAQSDFRIQKSDVRC
ncbi:MAG TPA: nucleoside hydrolase [Candidatus Fimenecus excrementigallinarum]|uniref:Nucleoside hydrolase n=1 Tax=Candidatus Fimenecus excrementigallinarum TaxID=2840816 RepID=A0A9D1LDX9_9FIRM|nr:nucleoside hydrolase [Candidatus Fimenecus excrementigallinarum]